MALSPKDLEALVSGKLESRAPFVGLGNFGLTIRKVKMKRDKGQSMLHEGKILEIPGKPIAYIVEARVDTSSTAKHPVGSDVAVYMGVGGKYEDNDVKNILTFVKVFYASLGIAYTDERDMWLKSFSVLGREFLSKFTADFVQKFAADKIEAHDETTLAGLRVSLSTKVPSATAKDGTPKAKVPTEEGFLYKNWAPVPQTVEEMLARRATLG